MANAYPASVEKFLHLLLENREGLRLTELEKKIDALIFYTLNQLVYDTIENSIQQPRVTRADINLIFEFQSGHKLLQQQLANLDGVQLFGQYVERPLCFTEAVVPRNAITVLSLFNQIFVQVLNEHPEIRDIRIIDRIRRHIGKIINPPVVAVGDNMAYIQRRVINYLTVLCHLVFLIPQVFFAENFGDDKYLKDPKLSLIISWIHEIAYNISFAAGFRGKKTGEISQYNRDSGHMDINGKPRESIAKLFESFIVEELAAMCSNGVKQNLPDTGDVFILADALDELIEVKSSQGGAITANVEISRKDKMKCGLIPGKQILDYVLYKTSGESRDVSFNKMIKSSKENIESIEQDTCNINRDVLEVKFGGIVQILDVMIDHLRSSHSPICGQIFTREIETNGKYIRLSLEVGVQVFDDMYTLLEDIKSKYQNHGSRRAPVATVAPVVTTAVPAAASASVTAPWRRGRKAYEANEEKDYLKLYLKYKNKYLQLKICKNM